jgi:uncharacterized membrane protein HdeD (DUF308 family)
MPRTLADKWWVLLINGLCAIAFGILAYAWPGATLLVLIMLFGVFCIIDGVTALMAASARDGDRRSWGQMLIIGIVSIVAGAAALAWPGLTAVALLFVIAVWAIVRGAFEIVAAVRLRRFIDNEWMLGLAGVVSVLFGVALIVAPGAGVMALIWLIAAYAIVHGVLLVMLAFKLRGRTRSGIWSKA